MEFIKYLNPKKGLILLIFALSFTKVSNSADLKTIKESYAALSETEKAKLVEFLKLDYLFALYNKKQLSYLDPEYSKAMAISNKLTTAKQALSKNAGKIALNIQRYGLKQPGKDYEEALKELFGTLGIAVPTA